MPHVAEGTGSPFRQPLSKARNAGEKRLPGRLFFGYFLLAEQKKVSRPPVREPALNQGSRKRNIIQTNLHTPRGHKARARANKANVDPSTTTTATKKFGFKLTTPTSIIA